jgi:hypothetical protein
MRDIGVAGNMINEWLMASRRWKSGRNEPTGSQIQARQVPMPEIWAIGLIRGGPVRAARPPLRPWMSAMTSAASPLLTDLSQIHMMQAYRSPIPILGL